MLNIKETIRILLLGSLFISNLIFAQPYSYSATTLPAEMTVRDAPVSVTVTLTNRSGGSFGLGAIATGDTNWTQTKTTCVITTPLANGATCTITGIFDPKVASTSSTLSLAASIYPGIVVAPVTILHTVVKSAADPLFVAVGVEVNELQQSLASLLYSSTDGVNWTHHSFSGGFILRSIAESNHTWVAIGNVSLFSPNGSGMYISTDGITWTLAQSIAGVILNSVAYGNGKWVAVWQSANSVLIYTSTDGTTWTVANLPTSTGTLSPIAAGSNNVLTSVVYGNGKWVAVGYLNNQALIYTSTDGVTWTVSPPPSSGDIDLTAVVYGDNTWMIIGKDNDQDNAVIYTSTDGTTWTGVALPSLDTLRLDVLAYGDGQWIVSGINRDTDTNIIYTSNTNGLTWTPVSPLSSSDTLQYVAFIYAHGKWVAIANEPASTTVIGHQQAKVGDGTFGTPHIFTSNDLLSWSQATLDYTTSDGGLFAVAAN
jgi:hypothetical protein